MSKARDLVIFGRKIRTYLSEFDDEGKGWHGRLSVRPGDDSLRWGAQVEYHVPSRHYSVRFCASSDRPLSASVNVGLFGFYLSAEHPALERIRNAVVRAWPLPRAVYSFSGREFSVSFHDHAVFWSLGADDMGWDAQTPEWRQGAWHPLGFFRRQGEVELVDEREVLVPMPERSYRAKARLERTHWGFDKAPRRFDRVERHVTIEMLDGEQIPFPGKGENSWDCGDDATFSLSCRANTIEDGVGRLVASVLRSRRRHGGANWAPAPNNAA